MHPLWDISKVPPGVLKKINDHPAHMRTQIIQDLLEKYEASLADLSAISRKLALSYEQGQSQHFKRVITELRQMQDIECGRFVEREGVEYGDSTN